MEEEKRKRKGKGILQGKVFTIPSNPTPLSLTKSSPHKCSKRLFLFPLLFFIVLLYLVFSSFLLPLSPHPPPLTLSYPIDIQPQPSVSIAPLTPHIHHHTHYPPHPTPRLLPLSIPTRASSVRMLLELTQTKIERTKANNLKKKKKTHALLPSSPSPFFLFPFSFFLTPFASHLSQK